MTYAIIGFGAVGQALATAFARKRIAVVVAGRRPSEALAQQAAAIGPTVTPKSLEEALAADTILLAVPFWEHREVAKAAANWEGKTVVDVTNAFGVPIEELDGLPSSAVVARAFSGAKLVKAFNVTPLFKLAPALGSGAGENNAVYIAGDDADAKSRVAELIASIGGEAVDTGDLHTGGHLQGMSGPLTPSLEMLTPTEAREKLAQAQA